MAPDDIIVSTDPSLVDVDVVHRFLLEESYWARGRTRDQVVRSIEGSTVVGAYRQRPDGGAGEQVAFARAVTDCVSFAWVCDVFVVRSARGRGLGKLVTRTLLDALPVDAMRNVLLGTADAHGLYAQLGFQPVAPGRFMRLGAARAPMPGDD